MHYKITVSRAVFMSFAVVLLVLISLVCLAPLWHVLMGSLSNPTQVGITQGLILYPLQNLDTHAYSIILTYQRLWNGYLNTFIYIFLQCVLTGVATIVAGYVFATSLVFLISWRQICREHSSALPQPVCLRQRIFPSGSLAPLMMPQRWFWTPSAGCAITLMMIFTRLSCRWLLTFGKFMEKMKS